MTRDLLRLAVLAALALAGAALVIATGMWGG